MKLSCIPISFFPDILDGRMSIADWARIAAETGLDGIDLSISFIRDSSARALRELSRVIEEAGVSVIMLATYPDFTHPDPHQRQWELAHALDTMRIASELGAKYVRVTAGQAHPETGIDEGLRWAVDGLSHLVESNPYLDVTPVYENHGKPSAWEYTDFSQPGEIFLQICRRTAGVGLGVNFDTANATCFYHDPMALLEQVIDRVLTIHAADTAVRGRLQPVLLGTGLTPFGPIFRRLKDVGFDGWICMEEASFGGREGLQAAADFVREAWEAA